MFNKKLVVLVVAIVAATVCVACFVGCEEMPETYADIVSIKVNNSVAEWRGADHNFDYTVPSELTADVPYTNYLRIEVIASPGADYRVYSDYKRENEIVDLEKIYVESTSKLLYIYVTNGEKKHLYTLDVTISKENKEPGTAGQCDNREGHVYIPEDAETVEVDGVTYTVVRDQFPVQDSETFVDQNYILASDVYWSRDEEIDYSSILNGNNYKVMIAGETSSMFTDLREGGVVKNLVLTRYENGDQMTEFSDKAVYSGVCYNNRGTIDNVRNEISYNVCGGLADAEHFTPIALSFFAYRNEGEILNCLNEGSIQTQKLNIVAQMGAFAVEQDGEMINCVNTGTIQNEFPYWENESGAGSITFATTSKATYEGVFNLGKCTNNGMDEKYIDQELQGIAFKTLYGKYPDLSLVRNYR